MISRIADNFRRYSKVFRLDQLLSQYRDSRENPEIPSWKGILAMIVGLCMRIDSINQIDRLWDNDALRPVFGKEYEHVSGDTLTRVLEHGNSKALEAYNAQIIRTAKANKCFPSGGTFAGLKVAGVDLTETYSTYCPTGNVAEDWCQRTVDTSDGEKIQYYQQAVGVNYIGAQPRLALGLEAVKKGQGESTTALRLFKQLDALHGKRWADVLVFDSYYPKAPIINYALSTGKHAIIKLKQDDFNIAKDVERQIAGQEAPLQTLYIWVPEEGRKRNPRFRYQTRIDDVEGLTSWSGIDSPLRCLKVCEQREELCDGQWEPAGDPVEYYIVTTTSKDEMTAELVWAIMHCRWDIENTLFNDLKQNWNFEHCYTRDVNAIQTVYNLTIIARNLMLLFRERRLRGPNRNLELKTLSNLLRMGLVLLQEPWKPAAPDDRPAIRFVGNLAFPAALG